jgi:hypothetical protein
MGKARDYIPALKYGHKIVPEDLAGMIGLPYVGKVIYVDPTNGSDSSGGSSQADAFLTVAAAYAAATSGNHDVIIIAPSGGTGRTSESTAITWAKRFTHLIGNAAPTVQDARAGISFAVGGSLTISENGCIFKNLTLASTEDINVPVTVSGDYNSFIGVDFKGAMNATAGDDAASRVLVLDGAQENSFVGCTFGSDTFMRSTTNATLEFANAASRNVFTDARFIMAADNVGPNHVLFTGTSAIDRWVEFNNCLWYSFWTNDADKVTHALDLAAQAATGHVLMTGRQLLVGFDDWEAADSGRMYFEPASATANAIGIGINPNVS